MVALDASTWWGGAALLESRDDSEMTVVAETGLWVRDSHAVRLLAMVETLLSLADWPRGSLDAWAATRGPGSFTGIRVALGTLRGLGLASGRPCYGVGTLDAMAEALGPAEADRIPLLDAGRGEVYGARFDPISSPPIPKSPIWVGRPARVTDHGVSGVVFGPGSESSGPELLEAGFEGRVARASRAVAAGAGRLALLRVAAGAPHGEGLSPLYVRPPEAEVASQKHRIGRDDGPGVS